MNTEIYQENYKHFKKVASEFLKDKYSPDDLNYKKIEAENFNYLVIERISKNEISIALYGKLNGDLMRDPEYTCIFDNEKEELRAVTYQNDYLGFYQQNYPTTDFYISKVYENLQPFVAIQKDFDAQDIEKLDLDLNKSLTYFWNELKLNGYFNIDEHDNDMNLKM